MDNNTNQNPQPNDAPKDPAFDTNRTLQMNFHVKRIEYVRIGRPYWNAPEENNILRVYTSMTTLYFWHSFEGEWIHVHSVDGIDFP
jgi:hypothetical protein